MKFNRNEVFGVCVLAATGIVLSARMFMGSLQTDPQATLAHYFDRSMTPAEQRQPQPRTPDNTGEHVERSIRLLTFDPR
jgi:hypothetical protein